MTEITSRIPTIKPKLKDIAKVFPQFLDIISVATGRATKYNTELEQTAAINAGHKAMLDIDRGVYALCCLLPTMDKSKQIAVLNLLNTPYPEDYVGLLTPDQEYSVILALINSLPTQRALKLFLELANAKVNNTRTRRAILTWILTHNGLTNLSCKYRRKLRTALTHAIGLRRTSILKSILAKGVSPAIGTLKERNMVLSFLGTVNPVTLEAVSFILGNETGLTLPILVQYVAAKLPGNLEAGRGLPVTTLLGIWRHYHREAGVPITKVYELSKLTKTEKLTQNTATKKAGVTVTFDPLKQDLIKLIIYAYEKGMTEDMLDAIKKKAKTAFETFPLEYNKVAFILDASKSMEGDKTQSMRPMAIALSALYTMRNAPECSETIIGGYKNSSGLVYPKGSTDVASAILVAASTEPDVIYIATDGYENVTAGRFHEVESALHKMGINIPIIQLTPVIGAEAMGTRSLSENIAVLPVSDMSRVGVGMLKTAFIADPSQGISMLLSLTSNKLTGRTSS